MINFDTLTKIDDEDGFCSPTNWALLFGIPVLADNISSEFINQKIYADQETSMILSYQNQ